ncbi:hypothetical protein F5876DRAFT_39439 [Lentinula aff. lateritia]|uniref:Uncharacterized protein n=1 Tax=Lentinula aff. lateritia TaxID=2804960 RepID=A0ACC1U3E7_9AGAR|nr:hypothetical protein F5876DRAFT_39439 [Lentinula aff. lateritia]
MQLLLYSKNHNGLRYFPCTGFLGVSNVVVEGVVGTKLDADLKQLPAKQITVSVRCYEFRLGRIGGVVSSKMVVDYTQVLWSKPDGNEFFDLGEVECPFKITVPPRSGGFSTVSFVEYRCVWRVEASISHAHISGIGTRLTKHVDLPLVRYDLPAFLPSPRIYMHITAAYLDRVVTKPKGLALQYTVWAPREPIGPTDLLPISIHVLPKERNISIRSASVVVERRIQFNESQSPVSTSSSSAIPISPTPSVSSFMTYSPASQKFPVSSRSFSTMTSPQSGYPSSVSLASDVRPLLPQPQYSRDRSDSSESLVGKPIVLPIAASESSGPFSQAENGIWSKTLTVQWPSAKPSSRWGIGETIHSDLVSVRFFARVKIIVTGPHSTESFELDEEEIFTTSTNDAERRLAISKTRSQSSSETRSKSKSPRRTRRKLEDTPEPVPSTSPSGLKPPSHPRVPPNPTASSSKRKDSIPRRPHTSAGPRDSTSSNFSTPKASLETVPIPSNSSLDIAAPSKKRPATTSMIGGSSDIQTTRNLHAFSPIISLSSTPSTSSGSRSSTLQSTECHKDESSSAAVREWEAELVKIELKSRRSSDLLGFKFKRKRPTAITCAYRYLTFFKSCLITNILYLLFLPHSTLQLLLLPQWTRYLTGFGYLLMKATVPTEEELYNRMAPDIRKKVDAARALRLAREAEMKQQVAVQVIIIFDPDTIKPIWADTNSKK